LRTDSYMTGCTKDVKRIQHLYCGLPSLKQIQPTTPLSLSFSPCLRLIDIIFFKRVRYAIQSAAALYPIIVIKLAIVEATNSSPLSFKVCDPFMGFGTTGVSALKVNRRFIGVNMDDLIPFSSFLNLFIKEPPKKTFNVVQILIPRGNPFLIRVYISTPYFSV